MSLPTAWVDALFTKLTLAYGRDFIGRWEGIEIGDVKTDWAHELSGFDAHPEAIAYALANLPAKAPTVIEFRALCRKAPPPAVALLPEPPANPQRVAAELRKLAPILAKPASEDGRAWARAILTRHQRGDKIRPITLQFARQAVGEKP